MYIFKVEYSTNNVVGIYFNVIIVTEIIKIVSVGRTTQQTTEQSYLNHYIIHFWITPQDLL